VFAVETRQQIRGDTASLVGHGNRDMGVLAHRRDPDGRGSGACRAALAKLRLFRVGDPWQGPTVRALIDQIDQLAVDAGASGGLWYSHPLSRSREAGKGQHWIPFVRA